MESETDYSLYLDMAVSNQNKISHLSKRIFTKFLTVTYPVSRFGYMAKAKTFWGDEMSVLLPEKVSTHLFRHSYFEEDLTRMLLNFLTQDMTFFDVGAHIGYYSLLASRLVGVKGHVHSFEPTPTTYRILKLNTAKLANVSLNNKAVHSKPGKISLNDFGLEHSAFNSLYTPRIKADERDRIHKTVYSVDAVTIDDYVRDTGAKPDFIKIDVESSEMNVLAGMDDTIESHHPIITLEVGDVGVSEAKNSRELIEYLIDRGYEPYECSQGKTIKHRLKSKYEYANILLLPK
ncbi:MAG: FkbM family methyltransferase [Candidatus Altiarchaeota archaeon]|nr:FkbM family methyltransferase [Candidatus Altiarchaeota archaeon]